MPKETVAVTSAPTGWWLAGSNPRDYAGGIDRDVVFTGAASAFLKSNIRSPKGFGTLMQMFQAKRYRGKRLRIIGHIKAERVERRAGLWMRVDGRRGVVMAFDNMVNRPIQGTRDWSEYPIVLDVLDDAIHVALGIILEGKGRVWLDHVSAEIVGTDVALTADEETRYPEEPRNLDFEEAIGAGSSD